MKTKDDQIDELQNRLKRRDKQIRFLADAEKTHKTVISRTVTERFPKLMIECFGGEMPIPKLEQNGSIPPMRERRIWNNQSKMDKLKYWQKQTSVNFLQAFRDAVRNPIYNASLLWKFTRIQRMAQNKQIPLPTGHNFFLNAVMDTMDTLASYFQPLSKTIHSTGAPFNEQNIMYAAEVCTDKYPGDNTYWEFASKLIVNEVLGLNI